MPTVEAKAPEQISKTPRSSKMPKWRALTLVLVHLAILAHILHWWATGETIGPIEPSEGITFSEQSIITAGLVFFIASILVTAFLGRWFCGWACHFLALQDACLWLMLKLGIRPKQMRSRTLLIVPIGAFVYMFLYPAIYRLVMGIELQKPTTEFFVNDFWATFPPWPVAIATFAIAGFGIVYFLGAKGFCTNVCPYGAAYGVADKLTPARIRVTDDCEGCGHCTQVCTSNVVVHSEVRDYGMVVDQECMKCLDCVSVCPKGALYFGFGKPAIFAKPHRARKEKSARSWWKVNRWHSYSLPEELLIAGLFAVAFFTFRDLYNTIPFLFALAIAAIFSFCAVQALRLIYKPRVQLQNVDLKKAGAITAAGRYYCGFTLVLIAFWAQSAYAHYHRAKAEQGYLAVNEIVSGWLSSPRQLSADEAQTVAETLEHVRQAESWTPLSIFPGEEWELALTSGWLHLLEGDDKTFEAKLRRAAEIFPNNYVPCDGLANYYSTIGEVELADEWFERATRATPGTMATWGNRSNYLLASGRLNDAYEVLVEATGVEDIQIDALMTLARFELSRGLLESAAEAFVAVLDIDPTILDARLSLAGVLRELGDHQRSFEEYELAIEAGADSLETRLSATLSCSLAGNLDRAEVHALAARAHDPERPEPWFALSQIARERGQDAEAEQFFQEAQLRTPNDQ